MLKFVLELKLVYFAIGLLILKKTFFPTYEKFPLLLLCREHFFSASLQNKKQEVIEKLKEISCFYLISEMSSNYY